MQNNQTTSFLIDANLYCNYVDILRAVESDMAFDYGLQLCDVCAEWADDCRKQVRVTIPANAKQVAC